MKNKILPIVTAIIVVIAVCVVIFIPKNNSSKDIKTGNTNTVKNTVKTASETANASSNTSTKSSAVEATLTDEGNISILTDSLDTSKATFLKFNSESGKEVELVAVKNKENGVDVAFNTCQSCNGSPRAYFVQKSNGKLECQNCGNQYPVSSIGTQVGAGCNPMTIDSDNFTIKEDGIEISKEFLNENASLFNNVAKH